MPPTRTIGTRRVRSRNVAYRVARRVVNLATGRTLRGRDMTAAQTRREADALAAIDFRTVVAALGERSPLAERLRADALITRVGTLAPELRDLRTAGI